MLLPLKMDIPFLTKIKACVFDAFDFGEQSTKEHMSTDIDLLYILYPNERDFVEKVKNYVKEFVVHYYLMGTFSEIDNIFNEVCFKRLEDYARIKVHQLKAGSSTENRVIIKG